jgi:protein-tyrosine phosphatase
MIDIHTHILPFVDDGSLDNNISIDMLKECVNQGITDVFLTPHYRKIYKHCQLFYKNVILL